MTSPEEAEREGAALALSLYFIAFVSGAIVMSFEMLGSRYLAPLFGAGIYTWAALISTVLAALCVGYFAGGFLADRSPSPAVLALTVAIGSLYLLLLPSFVDPVLQFFVWHIDDIKLGSLASALAIMLFPVAFLGMYSPFAIRLLLRSRQRSGAVSGTVYGISTAGSILGTLATTFVLIPLIGARAITMALGAVGLLGSALLVAAASSRWRRRARLGVVAALLSAQSAMPSATRAEEPFDPQVRAEVATRPDGLIAHVETVYNDVFVVKFKTLLKLTFQWQGWQFQQSEVNLADPDDLSLLYDRAMTVAALYPPDIRRVLVLGLGGGCLPVYLHRFLADATIDAVELDPGVIDIAKRYFGVRETGRLHLIESDARVFLNRSSESYDLILVDAFNGSYIPFHLMTKEFYELVRRRLNPHGVAAYNILPAVKLFASNVRTLQAVADNLDFFDSGERVLSVANVIVVEPLDRLSDPEKQDRAAAAQARYHFRYDLSRLLAERRIPAPDAGKGQVLTDDYAPADVLDAYGRSYRRQK